jgi:leucyl aminopeptidase
MAKRLMELGVQARQADAAAFKADVLAVGVFEESCCCAACAGINRKLGDPLLRLKALGDFEGKAQTTALVYGGGKVAAERVLFVGLGARAKCDGQVLFKAASLAASKAVELKAAVLGLLLYCGEGKDSAVSLDAAGQAMAEGIYFGAYRYDEYMGEADKRRTAKLTATILTADATVASSLKRGAAVGCVTGSAQRYARTIANRPANVITPATLAAEAKRLAGAMRSLKCTVLDEKQLAAKKMGGILAVGQGSNNPPRLIVLQYKPAGATTKTPTVGLVGKAITFDSGGISLKPGEGMQDMKFDKSGGLATLGAMRAIAQLRPKVNVFGLIPAAENMPSGKSYRPGDIITTYCGKTVEIQNTDAEGRMILCDAIAYAKTLGCGVIVDIATLTGACVVALGQKRAGVMGNDDGLIERLKKASAQTGERVWHLPCDDEFVEAMKSKVADLKNTGGKWGGACTAAAFLSQFAEGVKWAHIDMAGVGVWGGDEKDAAGSIGFGVRLLTAFAAGFRNG